VINAFKWNWQIPSEKVEAKVENGWVTLDGVFQWNYQRDAAKNAVKDLLGVKGVSNNITIKSENHDDIEKKSIELALDRNWATNGLKIMVKATGHNVTLSGTVDSWYQKEEAGRIAFNAPGVWKIENDLVIDYN
jgi:VCBS repeat-containing protein